MKVILLDNIGGVGQIGDAKEVNDGYARNYLFPRRLAKPATPGTLKEADALKRRKLAEVKLATEAAAAIAEKLQGLTLAITEKASASGKLFAAVGKEEIIRKLKELSGFVVAPEAISIPEHAIKTVGEHTAVLELTPDVKVSLPIIVSASERSRS